MSGRLVRPRCALCLLAAGSADAARQVAAVVGPCRALRSYGEPR